MLYFLLLPYSIICARSKISIDSLQKKLMVLIIVAVQQYNLTFFGSLPPIVLGN